MSKKDKPNTNSSNVFPPIVSVLGHVDHGKTSLLDTIRKTDIAGREHGGITQRIGASRVETLYEGQKRAITFIDTPGHEAFTKMRSRGAQVADIGLLIISASDGIMPQTKESIHLLKEAKIPFIVVLTKVDLQEANPQKIKQQLVKEDIMVEGLGGDVPVIEVSAKTGKNIKELLDLIFLVSELHGGLISSSSNPFKAIVIESKLDQKAGPRATLVIKSGTLNVRDVLSYDGIAVKVRTIINDKGGQVQSATVGDAVEVLGFEKVPPVGSIVGENSEFSPSTQLRVKIQNSELTGKSVQSEEISLHADQAKLSIILCTDTQGSLEAIRYSLPSGVNVVMAKTGDIMSTDILMAKSIGAIVIGFNIKIRPDIVQLARTEKILVKNYTIIYQLLQELTDAAEGKMLAQQEEILGSAQILASFPFEKTKVLGIKVLEGRIARGDKVRLTRGEETIGEGTVTSVRQGKNAISKIEKDDEGGIILTPFLDFTIGDMVLSVH